MMLTSGRAGQASGGRSAAVTMMSEASRRLTIRNAREADDPQIVELLFKAFHRWPHFEIAVPPIEHLRWKLRSDEIAPRHQWVCEIDGRIVGAILRVVRRVRVRGRDCLARDGVDAAVDPHYEGQRIYNSIVDHAHASPQASEFDLGVWYTTNPRAARRGMREGRAPLNPIQVLQKPCRPHAIVARRRKKYGGRLPMPLAILRIKLDSVFNRLGYPPYWRRLRRNWSIRAVERFDDRIEGFFDEAAQPFDFAVVKTKDYMNWRYFDPAAARFTVRAAEDQGKLLGYVVFKVTQGEGYVADLLALPGRTDVVRSLIEDVLRLFREADVEQVTCWMISRHPYNRILRRYGFIDSRRDVGLRYMPVSLDEHELEFLSDACARIHLTHGDTDWI